MTEHEIARAAVGIEPPRLRLQDGERGRRQRDQVLAPVLGALRRQRDHGAIEIDLGPAQAGDLIAAGAGQDQQPDDRAVLIVAERAPDQRQFVVVEHACAGASLDAPCWC